jgi:hypothetical protein
MKFQSLLRTYLALLVTGALLAMVSVPAAALTPSEAQKLLASDGARGDSFGYSVAVSGDTALIGAWGDAKYGSAYVFTRDAAGTWTEQQKLSASEGLVNDVFGQSVAVAGDTAVIGNPGDDENGSHSGSAYVFTRDASGTWTEQAKLTASDTGYGWQLFGTSVAIDGDTVFVGKRETKSYIGSVYVFTRDASGTWTEQTKLTPSDGPSNDLFGQSVDIAGDTAVIGAPYTDTTGAAYVFTRDASGTWTEQAKLTADDAVPEDDFGRSVAIDGDIAIIGASAAYHGAVQSGAAYLFTRDASRSWTEQAKLTPSDDAAEWDRFGWSVAIAGDVAVIGSHGDDGNGSRSGAAYMFARDASGTWTEQAKLTASDAATGDSFGWSVTVSGAVAMVGAPDNDGAAEYSGSAYVFNLPALWLSDSSDRTDSRLLDEQVVVRGDKVCVYVQPELGINQVAFFLDGSLQQVERYAPYDFAGTGDDGSCNLYDTLNLTLGEHSIGAEIQYVDGTMWTIESTFEVATVAPSEFALRCSADATVTGADPACDSGTFADGLWIYLWPESDVNSVDFYLDGNFRRTERFAPYELDGGAMTELGPGSHTVRAVVQLVSGATEEVSATFNVGAAPTDYALRCSSDGTVNGADPACQGGEFSDGLWIYLWPEDEVNSVDFYLDGNFRRTERFAPYELDGGARTDLSSGSHTVRAVVRLVSGATAEVSATFTVGAIPSSYTLLCSADAVVQGGDPACDGGVFSAASHPAGIWVYLWPEDRAVIDYVDYRLNGASLRRENYAPWELYGGAPLALPGSSTSYSVTSTIGLLSGTNQTGPAATFTYGP